MALQSLLSLAHSKEAQAFLSHPAVAAATSFVRNLRPLEAVGLAALLGLGLAATKLVRLWFSDCDFEVAAAARRMPKDAFAGKVVWIVGASSGIGEALAYELAARGASLILSARRVDLMMKMQDKCHELGAPEVLVQKLDVTAFDTHAAVVASVYRRFPAGVDYLVNNAGRSQRGLCESTPLSVDQEMFTLNVFGVLSLTKAVLPRMLEAGKGVLAFTSSVAGKVGSPISASYAGTKHALQGWTDSVRMEVGSRGISVVNVCPGPVESEITLRLFTDKPAAGPAVKEDSSHRMPAERCAHLYAAALWARLPEVWVSPQPILLFVYLGQYVKSAYFWLGPAKAGPARVKAFKAGEAGYGALQSVTGLLAGSGGAAAGAGAGKKDK